MVGTRPQCPGGSAAHALVLLFHSSFKEMKKKLGGNFPFVIHEGWEDLESFKKDGTGYDVLPDTR